MIRDLRLALRLVTGGGRTELARLGLLGAGLTITVTLLLLVAVVPHVLAHQDSVLRSREPVTLETRATSPVVALPEVAVIKGSWRGRPLTRIFVSTTDPDAPPPPGTTRLPRPGERLLSPAAGSLLRHDPELGPLLPGRSVGEVGSSGLTGPDELLAYIGVAADLNPHARALHHWGLPAGTQVEGTGRYRWLALELAVLVLPSLGVFMAACSRLAAATRRRRYAALALVGVSRRTLTRIATTEVAVAAVLGTVLGVALHGALNARLGSSGTVGFTWFPAQGHLDGLGAVALVAAVALSARLAGAHSSRRATVSALRDRREPAVRTPSWWRFLPLTVGAGLLVPLLPYAGGYRGQGPQLCLLVGAALTVCGVFLTAGGLSTSLGATLARARVPFAVRLGAHRLRAGETTSTPVLGLGLLILVGTLGSGISATALESASSATAPIQVHLYADDVPAEARAAVAALGKENGGRVVLHSTVRPDLDGGPERPTDPAWQLRNVGVSALVGGCGELRATLLVSFPACQPGHWYRVLQAGPSFRLPPGLAVPFTTPQGTVKVTAPEASLTAPAGLGPQLGAIGLVYAGMRRRAAGPTTPPTSSRSHPDSRAWIPSPRTWRASLRWQQRARRWTWVRSPLCEPTATPSRSAPGLGSPSASWPP